VKHVWQLDPDFDLGIDAGLAGTVLPALPGIPLIFGGVLLAAWIDDFQRISVWTIAVLGVLAAIGLAIDYIAAAASARRAGASKQGVIGAAVGTVVGGAKARQNQQAQNQQAQQQQQQALNKFYKAYGACMEGRGYSVK